LPFDAFSKLERAERVRHVRKCGGDGELEVDAQCEDGTSVLPVRAPAIAVIVPPITPTSATSHVNVMGA
jgi:hypothetical protein